VLGAARGANARIITDLHGESTSLDPFNFQHRVDFPSPFRSISTAYNFSAPSEVESDTKALLSNAAVVFDGHLSVLPRLNRY
jgi:hypothetical protein